MVQGAGKGPATEDDLLKLAAQAGQEEGRVLDEGLFLDPIGLGRVEDPGFETRVKAPNANAKQPGPKAERPKPRNTVADRAASEIAEAIEEKMAEMFAAVTAIAPVTGVYGAENAPKAVKAMMAIGKRRPAVMKALVKFADGAAGLEIGQFAIGLIVALQVDMGRLQADALPAQVFGVTKIVQTYFAEEEQDPANPNVTGQAPTNGLRYQPV